MPAHVSTTWYGAVANERAAAGAHRGVGLAAEHLLEVSRRLVPIEEDTLERSGTPSVDGLTAAVSYSTPYAVIQHENLQYRHDPGRTAKYLEGPAGSEHDVMLAIVAAQIRRALR